MQASVTYDFEGQTHEELTVRAGEFLTVTNPTYGSGWVEARNSHGVVGLVPEQYIDALPPNQPPPPLPAFGANASEWIHPAVPQNEGNKVTSLGIDNGDWSDDDWSDEDNRAEAADHVGDNDGKIRMRESDDADLPSMTGTISGRNMKKAGFRNRFSTYVKSGSEGFMLGTAKTSTQTMDKCLVVDGDRGPIWQPNSNPYTIDISDFEKAKKYHGMKSFISYRLTTSNTDFPVDRRYKQFDWLLIRLVEKYPTLCIPALPDKQVSGRFETDFISMRKNQLQTWISRMCRHPVIASCQVFRHFTTCTDDKAWKQVELEMEKLSKFIKSVDISVKLMSNTVSDNAKRYMSTFKSQYQRMGNALTGIATSFDLDNREFSNSLTECIRSNGNTYNTISELCANQPYDDAFPLINSLNEYSGIISTLPDILSVQKGAMIRARECQKYNEEGKMDKTEMLLVSDRCDTVSYTTLAETNHFHQNRVVDFKEMMVNYLTAQIKFHQEVTNHLSEALKIYNNL